MPTRRRRLKKLGHFFRRAIPDADMDVVLPSQFLPPRQPTPEQALMLAVLEDAENCIREGQCFQVSEKKRAQHDRDVEWLTSRDRDLFSFENVCLVLGFDAESTRERLLGMRKAS